MDIRNMNMHFSLKRVILLCVLLNCVIIGLTAGFILVLSNTVFTNSRVIGFFDLGIIGFLLPLAGLIAGFKIGNLYVFIYNMYARLFNLEKIELKTTV